MRVIPSPKLFSKKRKKMATTIFPPLHVELCERDLAFIWLTQGEKPQRDAFYDFINNKLTSEILDDLNYQFLRRLKKFIPDTMTF